MSNRYYRMCRGNIGKNVRVQTREGRMYTGVISRVTQESVYLSASGMGIEGKEDTSFVNKVKTAEGTSSREKGTEIYFFPYIVPLAAIAGLTIIGASPFFGGFGGYGGYSPYGYGGYGGGYGRYGPYRRRGFY